MTAPNPTLIITNGTPLDFSNAILGYAPKEPDTARADLESLEDITVEEQLTILIVGSSFADARTKMESLRAYLQQAQRWAEGDHSGVPVYVQFRFSSADVLQRALLHGGHVAMTDDVWNWQVSNHSYEINVTWTRGIWEDDAETELPLATGGAGKTTGGVTVYNHDDAGHDDWVDIASADVGGVLRAPVRLEITNLSAAAIALLYIGHQWDGTPTSIPHAITGTTYTWAGDTWSGVATFSLTAAQMSACKGNVFRILARLGALPSGTIATGFNICTPGSLTVQYTGALPTLSTTDYLQDWGDMRLPPWLPGVTNQAAADLRLNFKKTGGGSVNVADLAIMGTDSFRVVTSSVGVPQNAVLVIDEINRTKSIYASSAYSGHVSLFGARPIAVMPAANQRLWFRWQTITPDANPANSISVRMYYRRRRLTL